MPTGAANQEKEEKAAEEEEGAGEEEEEKETAAVGKGCVEAEAEAEAFFQCRVLTLICARSTKISFIRRGALNGSFDTLLTRP